MAGPSVLEAGLDVLGRLAGLDKRRRRGGRHHRPVRERDGLAAGGLGGVDYADSAVGREGREYEVSEGIYSTY
jgi:hypothetical protein